MRPPRGSGGSCRTLLAQTSGSQNLRMSDPEPCSSNAHTLQMGKLRHTEKAGRGGAGSEVEDSEVYLCLQETQKPPLPPPRPQISEGGAGRARRGRDPGPADPRRGAAGPGSHCPAAVSLSASFSLFLSFSVTLLVSPVLPLHFLSLLLSLLSPTYLCLCLCLSACVSLPPGPGVFLAASAAEGPPDPTSWRRDWGAKPAPRGSEEAGGGGRPSLGPGPARAASSPFWL